MKKSVLTLSIILIVVCLGWLSRYRLLYLYNVWRMTRASEDGEINKYNDSIQALPGKTGNSCFVATYDDTSKPNRVRRAAARALMKSDPALAETVFGQHLDSKNPDVSGMAVRDMGAIGSKKYRNEILQKRNSSNEIIRWSVVHYLGHFNDAASIGILSEMRKNDGSAMIRDAAADQLNQLSKQTGNQHF